MATYQDNLNWVANAPGRYMNPDNFAGYQCKDVPDDQAVYLFGNWVNTTRPENAKDLYARANPDYYEKLPKDADVIPGDVVCYNGASWNGWYGHTGVVQGKYGAGFYLIQQDGFANTQPAKVVRYTDRNDVQGILRPKLEGGTEMATIVNADQVRDLFVELLGRPSNPEDEKNWVGKPWDVAYYGIKDSVDGAAFARFKDKLLKNGIVSQNDVNSLYLMLAGRDANPQEKVDWAGKPWVEAYVGIRDSKPADDYRKKVASALIQVPGTIDQETKDQIKETNENTKLIKGSLNGLIEFFKSFGKGGN